MKLIVKNNLGETVSIQIKSNETFMDLKERVEEEAGISLDLKDIALKGKRITETQRVMEYFLSYGETEEESPSNIYCAVPGCKNTKAANPDKVFFEFPSEEIRCHQWVLYCQRLNSGPGKKRLSLTSESTICSDHFRPDQFVKNTNTLLKRTAVPCVKMPSAKGIVASFRVFDGIASSGLNELDTRPYYSEESDENKDDLNVRLCRLCASSCDEFILIFDEIGRKLKLAEKINLCLPIDVQITDALPKQICRLCFAELEETYELADTCTLSHTKLLSMVEDDFSSEDLSVVSLNDTGEEVVIGSSNADLNDEEHDSPKGFCPLCKEGKMNFTCKKLVEDDGPSSIFCEALNEIDPLDLGEGVRIEKNDIFCVSDYADSLSSKKLVDPLRNFSKHSDNNFYCKSIYDTSDLDSQLDASSQDFSKENDPLKLDDSSSKSDNDQISECYSLTSPVNIINSDDSTMKTLRDNPLSPINEELHIEPDFYGMDTESENSNVQSLNELNLNLNSSTKCELFCRLCGNEFTNNIDLFKHSYSHSYSGFYQCSSCVTFFSTKEELQDHFVCHATEAISVIYCNICTKSFKSALALASHICRPEESYGNKCPVCSKYFRSESRLKYHIKCHDSPAPAYCEICDKLFPDEVKLQKHSMYIHNSRKAHCCEECGKVFKSEASMKYHQRAHQNDEGVKPFTCERCGKSFIRKSMLINHMTSSHKHTTFETPCFTCKLCYEAFPSTAAAVSHMDNHHKLECMDDSTYSFEMHTITRLFICEFCERCYAEGVVLNNHREQHPADSPYECKYCDSLFSSADEIKIHRRLHLNDEVPGEYLADFTIPKTYLCEYCERCFLNQVKYSEHLTVHYGPEPYQCRHCSFKFSTLMDAIEHRSTHGEAPSSTDDYNFYRPYECHYCNKTFAIEDALIKHIRMHTGEKPFICDQCGKGFSQSSGLYTHQKVHSSERPYSCSVCPRTFKIKGDRDVHVRKHSGDRPYKCEFCGKAFMTQHVYSQHRKIHTGERPYKCDVCGIAFRRSHVLTVHKRIHTGEKPNICDICGKRYRQKGDMLKHRRVQHGIGSSKQVVNQMGC